MSLPVHLPFALLLVFTALNAAGSGRVVKGKSGLKATFLIIKEGPK